MESNTREHILQVALCRFIVDGYDAVSFARLIKEAGVSKGSFYHYWPNKLALFGEVVDRFFLDYFRGFQIPPEASGVHEAIERMTADNRNMVESLTELVGDDVGEFAGYYLLVADAIRRIPQIREGSEKLAATFVLDLSAVVQRGIDSGELRPDLDARAVADLIVPLSEGSTLLAFFYQKEDPAGALERRLAALYELIKAQ